MMKDRSIQSEGAFGILKEDYGFDSLGCQGEIGVMVEVYCASIGFNIRKYHKARNVNIPLTNCGKLKFA